MNDKIELVTVFKKEITKEDAQALLTAAGAEFRKGMDSSRGKIYFYSTGPKFIVTFNSEGDRDVFMKAHDGNANIHEMYIPNWKIQKD